MDPEPEAGNLDDGGIFSKVLSETMKAQLVATRDAMLARYAQIETALCHYIYGGLTAGDRGYLNWREKMRALKQDPDFDPKNPVWSYLNDEIIAERNRT